MQTIVPSPSTCNNCAFEHGDIRKSIQSKQPHRPRHRDPLCPELQYASRRLENHGTPNALQREQERGIKEIGKEREPGGKRDPHTHVHTLIIQHFCISNQDIHDMLSSRFDNSTRCTAYMFAAPCGRSVDPCLVRPFRFAARSLARSLACPRSRSVEIA